MSTRYQEEDSDTNSTRDTRPRSKPPVRWSNDMNLGQLLQGGAVLVAVVGSYYAQSIKIERAEMRLGAQQDIIARIERITDTLSQSQHSIALTLAALTAKVDEKRRTP